VTEDKELVAPNVEQFKGIQPSGSSGKEHPSKFVNNQSWYKMTMQDAQEQKASRSMIRGNYSKKGRERWQR
jgi:hypothetical protein